MMKRLLFPLAMFSLLFAAFAGNLPAQSDLVARMANNERNARAERTLFSYVSKERSPRTGGHLWSEMVVETQDGVLRRLIDIDGKPLSKAESAAEDQRIKKILDDPAPFRKMNEAKEDDETHAIKLLSLLPKAFILLPDGDQEGCKRVAFRPNPAFVPTSYEERVLAVMAGTVSIKEPEDRLCKLQATITQPVEFGFGLLGKLNSGGHLEVTRVLVSKNDWKTSAMSVHVNGRILLLKNLSREQDAQRSCLQVLDKPISLARAAELTHP